MSANLAQYIVRRRKYGKESDASIQKNQSLQSTVNADSKSVLKSEQQVKASDVKQNSKPEIKPEPKTKLEPKLNSKSEVQPKIEPTPEVKPKVDPTPEVKPKVEPKSEVKPKVEPKSEVQPKIEPTPEVKPKVEPKPEVKPKVEPKQKVEPKSEVQPKVEPKTVNKPVPEQPLNSEQSAKTPSEPIPETKAISEAKPVVKATELKPEHIPLSTDLNEISDKKKGHGFTPLTEIFLSDDFIFGNAPKIDSHKLQNCCKGSEFATYFNWLTNGREDDMHEAFNVLFGDGSRFA